MGSGSFGSGGGGGGSASWGVGGGMGSFSLGKGRRLRTDIPKADEIKEAMDKLLRRRPASSYLLSRLANPTIEASARELILFRVAVLQNQDWSPIEERFGIDPGPGCLRRYTRALTSETAENELERSFARQCAEDFFLRALGDDLREYRQGDARSTLKKLKLSEFDHVVTAILASALEQLASQTSAKLPLGSRARLKEIAWQYATAACDAFRAEFGGRRHKKIPQVSTANFFRVLLDRPAQRWFIKTLRNL